MKFRFLRSHRNSAGFVFMPLATFLIMLLAGCPSETTTIPAAAQDKAPLIIVNAFVVGGSGEIDVLDVSGGSGAVGLPLIQHRRDNGPNQRWVISPLNAEPALAPGEVDADADGIADAQETQLLKRFRPYYRFSKNFGQGEKLRPTDVLFYLHFSDLVTSKHDRVVLIGNDALRLSPSALVDTENLPLGSTDVTKQPMITDYRLNVWDGTPARDGNGWDTVLRNRNTGLYGHVVPIRLLSPDKYDMNRVLTGADQGRTYYKVEFWQFFGFSNAQAGPAGNHDGDWTTVQLLYDPVTARVISVFHYAHGKESRFNMSEAISEVFDDGELECKAKDNVVRFARDPQTGEFSHPVVYIEHGGHEFWPSKHGFAAFAANHNGDDHNHHFLTATPPNLGEVEHPLKETKAALVILRFNGRWGRHAGAGQEPPQGPPLHSQWTWPASSSVRWLLKGLTP